MKRLFPLLFAACCLTGCNWVLLQFRGQVKELSAYSRWEDRPWGRTLVFNEPILDLSDIKSVGVSPVPTADGLWAIRYRYHTDLANGQRETAMVFEIQDGKMKGVAFPPVMFEMIGERNVAGLLRMTGGDSSPDAGVRDVQKAVVLRAVLGPGNEPTEARELRVMFEPLDPGNRVLKFSFEEGAKPGIYSKLRLVIGKPGEPASAVGAR